MRYEPQGEDRYAKFDMGAVRIRQAQHQHVPSWHGAHTYCLKNYDYEAAELIARRNAQSDECDASAHDDCSYLWCKCPHHSQVQFEIEHPQLKSLLEIESERIETEAA